jgi:putative acetyltransferase
MVTVRHEAAEDKTAIFEVHRLAFAEPDKRDGAHIARLVDQLRDNGHLTLSLLAERHGRVVGHVAISPARIVTPSREIVTLGLGPLGVSPAYQGLRVGAALMAGVFERLRATGHGLVFLLGHTWYYPRFGYTPAKPLGVRWAGDHSNEPRDSFMVKQLREGALTEALRGEQGVFHFSPEFDDA